MAAPTLGWSHRATIQTSRKANRKSRSTFAIIVCAAGGAASMAEAAAGYGGAMAQFVNPPNPYVINSGVNLTLEMLPGGGAPTNPNVVFQVWSNVAGTIQAAYTDNAAPFVYPAAYLNQVTPGSAQIQALVRNSSNQVVEIISFNTMFTVQSTPPPSPPPPPPTGPAPVPSIYAAVTSGMAPFAVHVHALNSTLNAGTINTARYEWNFGDPNANHNSLEGWSAAHIYNQAGTYTITLRVTNESGVWALATRQVTITAPSRSTIYVSPTGSDSNSGTSEASPIQTFAKAATMLANNRAILFKRGGTYNTSSTMWINHQNVIIGAYGAGDLPVLKFTSSTNYAKFIELGTSSQNVVLENLRFDSNFSPNNLIVRGIQPHGQNVTVRNCRFDKVSYALNCGGSNGVSRLLVQDNTAGVLGAYFSWAEGSDHVYLGNTVGGSVDEHNIRLGGVTRALIAHNDLTNQSKSTIWAMLGTHCYIADNVLHQGRFIAGPNYATSTPTERFRWLVFENNRVINQGTVLYSGAEDVMLRNNIITYHGGECFSVWGYISSWNRTCRNIAIVNNTGINHATQYGRFIKLGAGAENITLANNLYCAPTLNAQSGAANVVTDGANLNTQSFHHNYWANPTSGSNVHTVAGVVKTASQWAGYSQTSAEQYRAYQSGDLSASFAPMFNAAMGVSVKGVFKDFHGNPRPLAGAWTMGAVENNPGSTSSGPDINHDGMVNVNDMLVVLNQWGTCSATCSGDLNQDQMVNVSDLLILLNAWT